MMGEHWSGEPGTCTCTRTTADAAMTAAWDAGTLIKVISQALKDNDFPAVIAGIKALATVDPGKAQDILGTIQAGIAICDAAEVTR